jgi:hypothetical protein
MLYVENFRSLKYLADGSIEFIDAAAEGDEITIKSMLDNGMHPDTPGPFGWTALRKAAVGNNFGVAFELLNRGATVDAANCTGHTALMMACAYGHHEMVSLLLLYGADPNIPNCSGRTALMLAASDGHVRAVSALLDAQDRIDLTRTDRKGKTALQMAGEYGHDSVVKLLLEAIAERRETRLAADRAITTGHRTVRRGSLV